LWLETKPLKTADPLQASGASWEPQASSVLVSSFEHLVGSSKLSGFELNGFMRWPLLQAAGFKPLFSA
jgi:hypothetical protein